MTSMNTLRQRADALLNTLDLDACRAKLAAFDEAVTVGDVAAAEAALEELGGSVDEAAATVWGEPYGKPMKSRDGKTVAQMRRKGQKVRIFDKAGNQVGPEHKNVAPAVAWATAHGFVTESVDEAMSRSMVSSLQILARDHGVTLKKKGDGLLATGGHGVDLTMFMRDAAREYPNASITSHGGGYLIRESEDRVSEGDLSEKHDEGYTHALLFSDGRDVVYGKAQEDIENAVSLLSETEGESVEGVVVRLDHLFGDDEALQETARAIVEAESPFPDADELEDDDVDERVSSRPTKGDTFEIKKDTSRHGNMSHAISLQQGKTPTLKGKKALLPVGKYTVVASTTVTTKVKNAKGADFQVKAADLHAAFSESVALDAEQIVELFDSCPSAAGLTLRAEFEVTDAVVEALTQLYANDTLSTATAYAIITSAPEDLDEIVANPKKAKMPVFKGRDGAIKDTHGQGKGKAKFSEGLDEAKLNTGVPDVPEIGFERGTFYYKTKSGLKNSVAIPPAKRGDRDYALTKFRYELRNEANVPNAEKLIDKLMKKLGEAHDVSDMDAFQELFEAGSDAHYAITSDGLLAIDTAALNSVQKLFGVSIDHIGLGDFYTTKPVQIPGIGSVVLEFDRIDQTEGGAALRKSGFSGRPHRVGAKGKGYDFDMKTAAPLAKMMKAAGAKLVKIKESIDETAVPVFGISSLQPNSDAEALIKDVTRQVSGDTQGLMFQAGFGVTIGVGSVTFYFATDPAATPNTNVAFMNDKLNTRVWVGDFSPEGEAITINQGSGKRLEFDNKFRATASSFTRIQMPKWRNKKGTLAQVTKHVVTHLKRLATAAKSAKESFEGDDIGDLILDEAFDPAQPAKTFAEKKPWGIYEQGDKFYLWNSKTNVTREIKRPFNISGAEAVTSALKSARIKESIGEAKATGKPQVALLAWLEKHPEGDHELSTVARDPSFRGLHFEKVQSAASALAKKGLISYDGTSRVSLLETDEGTPELEDVTVDISDLNVAEEVGCGSDTPLRMENGKAILSLEPALAARLRTELAC